MKGVYFLHIYSNMFFRFFKFGHIKGENTISLKATILRKVLRLTLGTNTTIGDYARTANHTAIVPRNHNFDDVTKHIHEQGISVKGVTIGDDVWNGRCVRILDAVHIGDHAVIGAVAVEVPARIIRKRGEQKTRDNVSEK